MAGMGAVYAIPNVLLLQSGTIAQVMWDSRIAQWTVPYLVRYIMYKYLEE